MPLDDFPAPLRNSHASDATLAARLAGTRAFSREIASPLTGEDQTVQASEDASPAKWHLAHTTWFFEELVLKRFLPEYREYDPRFGYCFNSYYNTLGPRHPRSRRGLLTRPSAHEVGAYRAHVDEGLERLAASGLEASASELIEIGINHEQQHQELMLTDVLALFAASPLKPAYRAATSATAPAIERLSFTGILGGIRLAGHRGDGFAYDNEGPRHEVLLRDFRLANRPVSNGEWLEFMVSGGYKNASLWLSDGFAHASREDWEAPCYWEKTDGGWGQMTLHGFRAIDPNRPVTHVSFYEANAFAEWAGYRLPTEYEWEVAMTPAPADASPLDLTALSPAFSGAHGSLKSGGVWEWTQSAYLPYPGYRPLEGPLGEYNGKFMCNQFVLRGSSVATPDGHSRVSYRNFFYPHQRWQFMGVRLAGDV